MGSGDINLLEPHDSAQELRQGEQNMGFYTTYTHKNVHRMVCIGVLAALFLATAVQATPEQDQQLIEAAEAGDLAKVKRCSLLAPM